MLFLLAAYQGVADGSLDYIRGCRADLWVLHANANNILRGQSVLLPRHAEAIAAVDGIESVSPILFLLSKVETRDGWASVYLAGYDPKAATGGPPVIVNGRELVSDDEIIIDRAFAAKWGYNIGDTIEIQDTHLRIVGVSDGTNAFVIQYAFVTLSRAHRLLGLVPIVSCFLVAVEDERAAMSVSDQIAERIPNVAVYTHDEFIANNTREMQMGFLPFIVIIAGISAVVLTTLLSLLLSISILEARPDFATIKIIGASRGFLPQLVTGQALTTALAGLVVGALIFGPLTAGVKLQAPEVSVKSSILQVLVVFVGVGIMSVVSALMAVRRLRKIYPLEAFR
jgi:putative ABC transport system permease protein